MERRSFLKVLAGLLTAVWAVVVAYPIFRYLKRPMVEDPAAKGVVVCLDNELTAGTSKAFKFGNKPGLLIRDDAGKLAAFDATCTHLGCIVQTRPDQKDIFCACHNGVYSLDGGNVSGPPPKPLTALAVVVNEKKEIVVSRKT